MTAAEQASSLAAEDSLGDNSHQAVLRAVRAMHVALEGGGALHVARGVHWASNCQEASHAAPPASAKCIQGGDGVHVQIGEVPFPSRDLIRLSTSIPQLGGLSGTTPKGRMMLDVRSVAAGKFLGSPLARRMILK